MAKDKKGHKHNLEEDLFAEAMRGVRPLRQTEEHIPTPVSPLPGNLKKQPLFEDPAPRSISFSTTHIDRPYGPNDVISVQGGLSAKQWRAFKQGEIAPEYTIDLHNMTIQDASEYLVECIEGAYEAHCRTLLLIHGKGQQQENKSILKNAVAAWLKTSSLVLGMHSAPSRLGGAGALLVMIRRNRGGSVND